MIVNDVLIWVERDTLEEAELDHDHNLITKQMQTERIETQSRQVLVQGT